MEPTRTKALRLIYDPVVLIGCALMLLHCLSYTALLQGPWFWSWPPATAEINGWFAKAFVDLRGSSMLIEVSLGRCGALIVAARAALLLIHPKERRGFDVVPPTDQSRQT